MTDILPSLLSADFMKLGNEINDLKKANVDMLHYDVMDGHFVPNISFGYSILSNITAKTDMLLDVHLMISNPQKYVDEFIKAKASYITFHIETMHSDEEIMTLIDTIHQAGVKVGMSIKPGTDVHVLDKYLPLLDLILVMSVEPGFGGQKFNPICLDKIKYLSLIQENYHYLIEVDGGINNQTIQLVREAGCNLFVAGSYIFNQEDYKKAVDSLL